MQPSILIVASLDQRLMLTDRLITYLYWQEVKRNHKKWLAENRHMKYLWLPYTDSVVVVKNNPVPEVGPILTPCGGFL